MSCAGGVGLRVGSHRHRLGCAGQSNGNSDSHFGGNPNHWTHPVGCAVDRCRPDSNQCPFKHGGASPTSNVDTDSLDADLHPKPGANSDRCADRHAAPDPDRHAPATCHRHAGAAHPNPDCCLGQPRLLRGPRRRR